MLELNVVPKNTTQCSQPGPQPGPLEAKLSALTMRPLVSHTTLLSFKTL